MERLIAAELMDGDDVGADELEGSLVDIERVNRYFGGIRPIVREIRRLRARSLLDVCCGSADVPSAVVRDARRRGREVHATVLDRSATMLHIARRRTPAGVSLTYLAGDARALPFADGSFDVVTCNLALHHFDPEAAVDVLRELRRVARMTPLLCDLRRSPAAWAAAFAWSRTSRNRLTRHDAPMSVRRAYTPREAQALAQAAGWSRPRVRREPFFRMTLADAAEAR